MRARIASLTNANTLGFGTMFTALFAMMRGDRSRAPEERLRTNSHRLRARSTLVPRIRLVSRRLGERRRRHARRRTREHALRRRKLARSELSDFRRARENRAGENRSRARDLDRALSILDEALATADRLGYRTFEAELHRSRGEIQLAREPTNPSPAEEAFLAALAVAKQQRTRSFELRAAMSLAKLYQSTGRSADAYAVLVPAVEGFARTPESRRSPRHRR